jgi:uncharacterized repeat protein (TIGR03803 family)
MKPRNRQSTLNCIFAAVAAFLLLVGSAQAASNYEVLHYFDKHSFVPDSALVADSGGNLYGTTLVSGPDTCGRNGCGVVFKLTRGSVGKWSYSIIHHFKGFDGQQPAGNLIFDSSGDLYGITDLGGVHNLGTVFELSPSGGKWKEKVLHSFGSRYDFGSPGGLILDASGNLFGTAQRGGMYRRGGVFELQLSGAQWKETVLYTFTGGIDGGNPSGNLAWDSTGNLYGTCASGGKHSVGAVFELMPSGGSWVEKTLYSFAFGPNGEYPAGGVIFDTAGNLYGTTDRGGHRSCDCGTVFQLTPSMGKWNVSTLHAFGGPDGMNPAGLVIDSAGSLYGTTLSGGHFKEGVVFKLSQSGGIWTETGLHSFDFYHGANPSGGLIIDQQGVLYGNASAGGKGPNGGYGVVFSVAP